MRHRGQHAPPGPCGADRLYALMGTSPPIQRLVQQVAQVARTELTVLLHGETGTGKELVARWLHHCSPRAAGPFVAVDSGTIPESLAESELFGYVKGAFTGADGARAGAFAQAQGGTLFLDEIANVSPLIQQKLLRSIQERVIQPLGSGTSCRTDVRLIVASNVVLADAVHTGRFRADLFHRLNEFPLALVPLRDRPEDILVLAERFRREAAAELGKDAPEFTSEAQAQLRAYAWPGNVRELRNVVRRAVLVSAGVIPSQHLWPAPPPAPVPRPDTPPARLPTLLPGQGLHATVRTLTAQLEKALIYQALQEARGNKRLAAQRLQIGYKTLFRKMQAYDLG